MSRMENMRALITGGAGFIGSHLADALLSAGHDVTILDSLAASDGTSVSKKAEFIRKDILSSDLAADFSGMDAVFHLAADPRVRESATTQAENFELNVRGTFNVLEAARKSGVKKFLFTSTSAVYGQAKTMPTPEDYPTIPISNYAAGKLAGEAYCASFAHTYGMKSTIVRLANIFGERSTHGVMFDFYNKLKKDPKKLEILGDGKQDKSYLHVSDCISGMLTAFGKQSKPADVFNIGSGEKRKVDEIARLVSQEMGLKPAFSYTGGKQGWKGDVPEMLLSADKLKALGWKQGITFEEGVKRYVAWLKSNY